MSGGLPGDPLLDRAAVERIIQRAAELQAGERDIGDGLTEGELVKLGHDVGIPDSYLKQAMLEERTRVDLPSERGTMARIAGPRFVVAARAITGDAARKETALGQWMAEGELLQVKRRYPQQTSWEPKQGAMASLRRAINMGGRSFALTRAREVVGQVSPLETGRCHVRLVADLGNTRVERLAWAGTMLGAGAAATGTAAVIGFLGPVTWIPAILAVAGSWAVVRARRAELERVHVALEQILDRLEHGEGERQIGGGPALLRMADDLIRRGLGPGRAGG